MESILYRVLVFSFAFAVDELFPTASHTIVFIGRVQYCLLCLGWHPRSWFWLEP